MPAATTRPVPVCGAGAGLAAELAFSVAGVALAMAASDVAEVTRVPPCIGVPGAPAALRGVANLRGRVVGVVALGDLLGMAAEADVMDRPGARMLVLGHGLGIGLLVDQVTALSHATGAALLDVRALLERAFAVPPAAANRADAVADRTPATVAQDRLSLIAFRSGGQDYALPLADVTEVTRLPARLEPAPDAAGAVLGVMDRNGAQVPLVALAVLLGLPRHPAGPATRVMVVGLDAGLVGLVVDGVAGLIEVAGTAVDPVPPVLLRGAGAVTLDGIVRLDGGGLAGLLSAGRLAGPLAAARLHGAIRAAPALPAGPLPAQDGNEHHILFRVGGTRCSLPMSAVTEVVRHPGRLTTVPRAPGLVEGLMNLRGRAVPVIDMSRHVAAAAGAEAPPGKQGRRVIVVTIDGVRTGLAVDWVAGVQRLAEADGPVLALHAGDMLAAAGRDLLAGQARSRPRRTQAAP